jgi:tetratricopeptide (TPR) repeat protein
MRSLILLLLAVGANAQSRVEDSFVLDGSFFSTVPFTDPFEVLLLDEAGRPIDQLFVRAQEQFRFRGLLEGVYFIVADIRGFETVRQRVVVNRIHRGTSVNIFLEIKRPATLHKPLDLSGEDEDVVNVADLARHEPRLVTEIETADEELQSGDFENARERLEAIVKAAPDFYAAHKMLGAAYQKLQRFRDAEEEYRRARDLRPASAAPLISLGSLYLEEIEDAHNTTPADVRAILNTAMDHLLKALDLNPDAPFAHYLLGVAYYRGAMYEDAEDSLLRALELEDRLGIARLILAEVYIRIQELPNALTQLRKYLDENPDASNLSQVRQVSTRLEAALGAEGEGARVK